MTKRAYEMLCDLIAHIARSHNCGNSTYGVLWSEEDRDAADSRREADVAPLRRRLLRVRRRLYGY